MIIALVDEANCMRLCEVEDEPEPRFVLSVDGFDYYYERWGKLPDGTTRYYLVDAEAADGLGG